MITAYAMVRSRRKNLFCLIDRRNRQPCKRGEIDRRITREFERPMAVMITDSVGFTRKTRQYGIIQFIAVLKKVHDRLARIMVRNRGIVLEDRPDNFLTVFDSPVDAVRTAVQINHYLAKYNHKVPARERYEICTGIGYGPILFGGDCVFGLEVNMASKLGEDLAKSGEILLTENACQAVRGSGRYRIGKPSRFRAGGIWLKSYRILH